MTTFSGLKNSYKRNPQYIAVKKVFLLNPDFNECYRNYKETFKYTIATDFRSIIKHIDKSNSFTIELLGTLSNKLNGKLKKSKKTFDCIYVYLNNQNIQNYPYNRVIGNVKDYKLKNYLYTFYKNARKEIKCVLNAAHRKDKQEEVEKYCFALYVMYIALKYFYFATLPHTISQDIYNRCLAQSAAFANYYTFDANINRYLRIKQINKKQCKSMAITFNDNVAWILAEEKVLRSCKLLG